MSLDEEEIRAKLRKHIEDRKGGIIVLAEEHAHSRESDPETGEPPCGTDPATGRSCSKQGVKITDFVAAFREAAAFTYIALVAENDTDREPSPAVTTPGSDAKGYRRYLDLWKREGLIE